MVALVPYLDVKFDSGFLKSSPQFHHSTVPVVHSTVYTLPTRSSQEVHDLDLLIFQIWVRWTSSLREVHVLDYWYSKYGYDEPVVRGNA